MKITDAMKNAPSLPTAQAPASQSKGTDKTSAPAPAPFEGSVRLSSLSQQMQALGGYSGSGVFNAQKVEEIKFAIADGNFRVNSEKVADGLLATVRDLLHARKD